MIHLEFDSGRLLFGSKPDHIPWFYSLVDAVRRPYHVKDIHKSRQTYAYQPVRERKAQNDMGIQEYAVESWEKTRASWSPIKVELVSKHLGRI